MSRALGAVEGSEQTWSRVSPGCSEAPQVVWKMSRRPGGQAGVKAQIEEVDMEAQAGAGARGRDRHAGM